MYQLFFYCCDKTGWPRQATLFVVVFIWAYGSKRLAMMMKQRDGSEAEGSNLKSHGVGREKKGEGERAHAMETH